MIKYVFSLILLLFSGNSSYGQDSEIVIYPNHNFPFEGESLYHYGVGFHRLPGENNYNTLYGSGYFGVSLFTGGKQRFHITKNGSVGIGISTPTERLHTLGNIRLTNTGQSGYGILFDHTFNEYPKATSKILFDYYGHTYGGKVNKHGLIYQSGRPGFSNHWFIDDNGETQMLINDNGNVGIGTTETTDKLTIDGNLTFGNTTNKEYSIIFRPSDDSWRNGLVGFSSNAPGDDYIGLKTKYGSIRLITNVGNEVVRVTDNERVGIGTSTPDYKLDVNGTIRATEIKVVAQTADFVFDENYSLKDLSKVETFIKENKHLPDIPSALEMEASGVNLAEMNKLLLQKIEELTLYAIDKEKEVLELKEKDKKQTKKMEVLEERLFNIEQLLMRK
ncbi:hypothetical protein BY457_1214 [Marinilabilia salmonicolor]|jgi:hypothetical protein|uniref:hypothetical protein n=1 Tax=Marinilabilia salmonicolor TaxID=989 RepID=UPI000D07E9A3|nr:hypothetical protein [Marinilabilia salmonicolor]PRY93814.1 hypothetical protein BY457_1214 [Marinilabilia salmonicolor]